MFESASPDTFGYLILALAAVATIIVLFIGSLVVRYRSLQQDLHTIEQLLDEQ